MTRSVTVRRLWLVWVRAGLVFVFIATASASPERLRADDEVVPAPAAKNDVATGATAETSTPSQTGNLSRLEESLRQLQQQRRSVNAEFRAVDGGTTHAESSRTRTAIDVQRLRSHLSESRAAEADRSGRIRAKLGRLKALVERNGAAEVVRDHAEQQAEDGNDPPSKTQPDDTQSRQEPLHPPHAVETKPTHTSSRFPEFSTGTPDEDYQVIPVLSDPIDRLRLANNLYGSNELKLALDIYQRLDRSEMSTVDQLWVEFQIANCHRRLGNREESERAYRIVTSRDKDTWISQNARWWLDNTDRTTRLESRIKTLQQSMENVPEASNGDRTNP